VHPPDSDAKGTHIESGLSADVLVDNADFATARADLAARTRSGVVLASFGLLGLLAVGVLGFILVNGDAETDQGEVDVAGIAIGSESEANDDPIVRQPSNVSASVSARTEAATGEESAVDRSASDPIQTGGTEKGVPQQSTVERGIDPLSESNQALEDPEPPAEAVKWAALPFPQAGQLPMPDLLPLDAYAAADEIVIGTLEIPRLGVSEVLQQGMTLTAINRGPSHWPGTAAPGRQGNVVIAGHRTTHGAPFNGLDELVAGDELVFTTLDGVFTYSVRETEIVAPEALHIADQTEHAEATLFACHPKGSAAQRIVVRLDLEGAPTDAPADLDPLNGAIG